MQTQSTTDKGTRRAAYIFMRLAFQNLLRQPTRTFTLIIAVALCTGAIFASFIIGRGIQASMNRSFARMGADLIVVPDNAMVNITSALLTVQPTEATIDAKLLSDIAQLEGVAQVAPQTIYRVPVMSNMPEHKVNLIAFDPEHDFTVMPWLENKLARSLKAGDLIVGGRRHESINEEIEPCNIAHSVYGKLGRSGVGPLDESIFVTYDTIANIAKEDKNSLLKVDPSRISAILVRLKFGTTPEQVKFAIARFNDVKVITGATIVTSTRQSTSALLVGMLAFAALMLVGLLLLVSLVFSAIIHERRQEIGLLSAIGARRTEITSMLISEAAFTTTCGGIFGILFGSILLFLFQRSILYYLTLFNVEYIWPSAAEIELAAIVCAALATTLGLIGALLPAWQSAGKEPFTLIKGELA